MAEGVFNLRICILSHICRDAGPCCPCSIPHEPTEFCNSKCIHDEEWGYKIKCYSIYQPSVLDLPEDSHFKSSYVS